MSASQNVVILRSRVVKRQDGSFHLWINVWVAKLCDPVIDVNTARLEMSISLVIISIIIVSLLRRSSTTYKENIKHRHRVYI